MFRTAVAHRTDRAERGSTPGFGFFMTLLLWSTRNVRTAEPAEEATPETAAEPLHEVSAAA